MKYFTYIGEGLRLFKRSLVVKKKGTKRYEGNSQEICIQIIEDCWNERFFQTSAGHFSVFYIRDLSFYVEQLISLGHTERLKKSYAYAIEIYRKHNKITTTINPKGIPIDIYTYSIDSLPLFLRSLRLLNATKIIDEYKDYLENEIKKFYKIVIDKKTGLVKKDKQFSSAKDHSKRKSSMYDNVMAWILQQECDNLNLINPLKNIGYKKLLKEKFWTGNYFLDDLSREKYISGDANTIPYWAGLYDDKKMIKKSIESIQKAGLDSPFPLKYTNKEIKNHYHNILGILASNYEGNAIWMQWGLLYLEVVKMVDKKLLNKYLQIYSNLIEKHGNYLEVFNPDGSIYSSPIYYCDESMIWCAGYLGLMKKK
ncbi:hypothetical protein HOD20_06340 [archaeon]|jgi:hypothetical protein|nr:hypothetical protein [archaeon]MBT4352121.1 hypothetical protein [archaeon]MBT4648438.1 hypothetical protein [archaeon]MBT6821754.1 hypothetical protein [archaeon]MBT7391216.1 hypothetical protein [archaeon]